MTRVLVVDDNPDVLLALRMMLEATEHRVLEADDGATALTLLRKQPVDIILTDIVMPGIDGLSLIDLVRRQSAPLPAIIAMTGLANLAYQANLEAARALGADALLVKPFAEAELQRLISELTASVPATAEPRSETGPIPERRSLRRTPVETRATALLQALLRDVREATGELEKDLRKDGDAAVVSALLTMAQALALSRGIDIQLRVEEARRRLHEAGYAV